MNELIQEQAEPKKNDGESVWKLVMLDVVSFSSESTSLLKDMRDREELGIKKYGTPVQAFNGRDCLIDAYQEMLDCVVYLRQKLEEFRLEKVPLQLTNRIRHIYRDQLFLTKMLREKLDEQK